jgi:hypothetical protein
VETVKSKEQFFEPDPRSRVLRPPIDDQYDDGRASTGSSWECLLRFISIQAGTGSFDCVIVRFANDNFAQDESFGGAADAVREDLATRPRRTSQRL